MYFFHSKSFEFEEKLSLEFISIIRHNEERNVLIYASFVVPSHSTFGQWAMRRGVILRLTA